MKVLIKACLVLALGLGFVVAAAAGDEVTLNGTLVCAKCSLKKADAHGCQDVLIVAGEKASEYYVVKNETAKKFGHACRGEKPAKVTGTVSEKDGKQWITASSMESPPSQ